MGNSPKVNIKKAELNKSTQQIDSPVQIEDIIVTGKLMASTGPLGASISPLGEFGKLTANTNDQTTRLFSTLKSLVDIADAMHKSEDCDSTGNIKRGHENNLVRLVTNEFSFFTAKPLTTDEFHDLYQKIEKMAQEKPKNLQLVLSSFAVKTPDNKLMNVALAVDCGKPPKIHCFAKNNISAIDPIYYEVNNGVKQEIRYISKADFEQQLAQGITPIVNIKGIEVGFSNVFESETAGKAKFFSCIELCLDHKFGTAKEELLHQLRMALLKALKTPAAPVLPIQVSHVITSNSIGVFPENVVGRVTQADPLQTPFNSPDYTQTRNNDSPSFGTPLHIAVTTSKPCSPLPPAEMDLVNKLTTQDYLKAANTAPDDSRVVEYINRRLMDIGKDQSMTISQKQDKAQKVVSDFITSVNSVAELQKLFEHIQAQIITKDNKAGLLSYLRKNSDGSDGFPPRFENIINLIKAQTLDISTHTKEHFYPLLKELTDFGKKLSMLTPKENMVPNKGSFLPMMDRFKENSSKEAYLKKPPPIDQNNKPNESSPRFKI